MGKALMLAAGILLFGLSGAFADGVQTGTSYRIYDGEYGYYCVYGHTWLDAEKKSLLGLDSKMCWAAAASNLLGWGNWELAAGGTRVFPDVQSIFSYFYDHWTNQAGSPGYAMEWWIDGNNYGAGDADFAQVSPDGGGFGMTWFGGFTSAQMWFERNCYVATNPATVMSDVEGWLNQGRPAAIVIAWPDGGGGHALTCWGYNYDPSSGTLYGLWVTDSDDAGWYSSGSVHYYAVRSITEGYALDYGSNGTCPINQAYSLQSMVVCIPEPSTLFALVVGLGTAFLRRKARI